MSMFCYQCQEAAKGVGCTVKGVCGKEPDLANIMDVLMYQLRGIAVLNKTARENGLDTSAEDRFIFEGLFMTITNANFDHQRFIDKIREGFQLRLALEKKLEEAGVTVN
ncbi:MAG: hydroxylamine reductase, partial [Bacteroidota bacterium]